LIKILRQNKIYLVYYPLAIYWLLLIYLTSVPTTPLDNILTFSDKFKHFIAYFLLSVLFTIALFLQQKYQRLKKQYLFFSLSIVILYGLLDEIHQLFIPGRFCDPLDFTADTLGAIAGTFFTVIFIIKREKVVV